MSLSLLALGDGGVRRWSLFSGMHLPSLLLVFAHFLITLFSFTTKL